MASSNTPELPDPNLSEDDLRQLLVRSLGIVSGVEQSPLTGLIAELLEMVVAQRLELLRLAGTPVSKHLLDAFNEGIEQARQ